jgi:hypothetical protein
MQMAAADSRLDREIGAEAGNRIRAEVARFSGEIAKRESDAGYIWQTVREMTIEDVMDLAARRGSETHDTLLYLMEMEAGEKAFQDAVERRAEAAMDRAEALRGW